MFRLRQHLVIEIDVTSYTDVNDYLPYRVPEVWLFKNNQLKIYSLQGYSDRLQPNSCYFPSINVKEVINECLQITYERNSSAAIRELRQKLTKEN